AASRRRGRRSRTAGRIRLAVLLALLAAIVALVVVATSSGSRSSSSSARNGSDKRAVASSRSSEHHPSSGAGATGRADALRASEVQRVLAYTPFITGGTPRHRVVALTFDDGPSPYTIQIIRELVRMHAPATFFVVGQQLNDFSAALRDELRHGFAIGDHTENHAYMVKLSAAGQYKQIHDAVVRIERLGAPVPLLF